MIVKHQKSSNSRRSSSGGSSSGGGGGGCSFHSSGRSGWLSAPWQRSVSTVHIEGIVTDQVQVIEESVHTTADVEGFEVCTVPVALAVVGVSEHSVTENTTLENLQSRSEMTYLGQMKLKVRLNKEQNTIEKSLKFIFQ